MFRAELEQMNLQYPDDEFNGMRAAFIEATDADEFSISSALNKKINFMIEMRERLLSGDITSLEQAELISNFVHGEIKRDDGKTLYIEHPRGMVASARDDIQAATRWLHDVIEESDKYSEPEYIHTPSYRVAWTMEDLEFVGQPARIVRRVGLMTRRDEPYLNYAMRMAREAYRPRTEDMDVLEDKQSDMGFNYPTASARKQKVYALVGSFFQAIIDQKISAQTQIEDFARQRGLFDPDIFQPKYYNRDAAMDMGLQP